MQLSRLLSFPTVLAVASALAIERRDADFYSVRTKMNKDMSGRKGDPKGKYFHESVFHPHYDGRFADRQLGYRERKQALSNLIQTYLSTFADLGVETWLMHGTLLGWWWNRKILPWDSDSDFQVTESSMHYLASYYNMTIFHYKTPRIPEGRDYMLEINSHYLNREQTDKLNVIDARWVDTTSGLFIDITTARYNTTHPAGAGMLSCKDGHEYRDTYIFPLRDTYFEGVPAKIPFGYKELLESEYKQKALTMVEFEGHHFDEDKQEWLPILKQVDPPKADEKKSVPARQEEKKANPAKQEEKKAAEAPNKEEKKSSTPKQEEREREPSESEETTSQQPIKEESRSANDASDSRTQSQTEVKPKPPVPQQPAEQKAADEKILKLKEKQSAAVKNLEDKRRSAEQNAIVADDKRIEKQRVADEGAALDKAKKEAAKPITLNSKNQS